MTNTRLFVLAGLLIGLALALFVSPFASGSPDGLESVAEEQGFADRATDHVLAESPLADYDVRGVDDDRVATAVSGAVGVLLTFGIATAVFAAIRVVREGDRAGGDGARPASGPRSGTAPDPT